MKILGIHSGHNASACLLDNGQIKYAIQEERLRGIKNWWGFPELSVKKILEELNLNSSEIDLVALSSHYVAPGVYNQEQWLNSFETTKSTIGRFKRFIVKSKFYKPIAIKRRLKPRLAILKNLGFNRSQIKIVDHHLCHASAAYYSIFNKSPQSKYLILTLDGGGDGLCSTVNIGEKGRIKRIAETPDNSSLGNIYSRTTYYLGFIPWEHEYKLMGMAPYVPFEKAREISHIFEKYLILDPNTPLVFKRLIPEPTSQIVNRLKKDLYRIRFDWICAGLQKFTENLILRWVKNCIKKTGIHKVVLSGGVFMNVKVNQKILELPEVEELFIMPSCGDETNSIGAAYRVYAQKKLEKSQPVDIQPLGPIYFGNNISDREVEKTVKGFRFNSRVEIRHYEDIEKKVAELLAKGEIVARAKGRMEFGARALGNRSILANPSNVKVVKIINEIVKKRDFWMPFAPSVLAGRVNDYYIKPKSMPAPYMIITFNSRPEKRNKFIAACHPYDFTTRPQEVFKEWNVDYWKLLKYFEQLTGEGIILNTSFNLHGYPIVSNARGALDVFNHSGLKYLALGNYLIRKNE